MPRVRNQAGTVRVGISGWSYKSWRGIFYPKELRVADHLHYASRAFPTIELNGSFYSLQRPASYRAWFEATPDDFVFAIKGSRYITHLKRLQNVEEGLANFFASGLLELGRKLGPILWQLPPKLAFDAARLRGFFELLPRSHADAAKLARGHSPRFAHRVAFGAGGARRLRYALEFRHSSFVRPEAIELFRAYGIAPCVADTAGLYPLVEDLCADFVYVRLHGAERLYTSGYTEPELSEWAERISAWRAGRVAERPRHADPKSRGDRAPRDVFVYFDNDVKAHAPFDAWNLARILRGEAPRPAPFAVESIAEEPRTVWPAWQGVSAGR